MSIPDVSHDESIFPLSRDFVPDRWLGDPKTEDGVPLERFLVSFGRGTRSCLGIKYVYVSYHISPYISYLHVPSTYHIYISHLHTPSAYPAYISYSHISTPTQSITHAPTTPYIPFLSSPFLAPQSVTLLPPTRPHPLPLPLPLPTSPRP